MKPSKIVVLPFLGEFGYLIMYHIGFIETLQATKKIVCCERGQEFLFPTATSCFTEWLHPIADRSRRGGGAWDDPEKVASFDESMQPVLTSMFPDYKILRPVYSDYPQNVVYGKPRLNPRHILSKVQVALAPRFREWGTEANWPFWAYLISSLQAVGITVGICGVKQSSYDVQGDQFSWDHPDGETAGTVDLLQHCDLYVGTDSGVSHLAAMLDTPMLVFRKQSYERPADLRALMVKANRRRCELIPEEAWYYPNTILSAVLQSLSQINESCGTSRN